MGSVKKTETGSVLNFNTYLPKQLTETKISFSPQQEGSGTPSPENMREIVGKNGITVWQSGKNLLNPNDADWGQYTITPTGEHTEETDRICSGYIPCNEGDTFTFSGSIRGSASYVMSFVGIAGFDKDKVYVNRNATNYVKKISYTVPNGVKYIRVFEETPKYPNITMEIWCNTLKRQLEHGSEATAYEPFTASVETSVSFDDVPQDIDSSEVAGTIYGGYVDISKGVLVAEWAEIASYSGETLTDEWLSDRDVYSASGTPTTGAQVVYKLAEPIHYPLSPRILTTLQGNNVMWSDGDSLTISYTDDVVNTYDFRRHISLDTPHKASASGAVASFGTDMVGKMKCKIHFSPQQEGSGTPSPDNVRNISGRSSVKLWQSSENLIDITAPVGEWPDLINGKRLYTPYKTYVGVHYSSDNYHSNSVSYEQVGNGFQFTSSNPSYGIGITFCVPQNAKIIANISSENAILENIQCYDREWNFLKTIRNAQKTYQTTPSNACYGKAVFVPKTANILSIVTDFTLVIGTEIPEHLPPRTGNEITFTFPSTVGDNGVVYGGYLDAEKGEVVAEYAKIQLSDLTWSYSSGWSNPNTYCVYVNGFNGNAYFKSYDTKPWLCNVLPVATRNEAYTGTYRNSACFCFSGSISKGTPTLRLSSASVSSIEEATKYIADNNMIAVYKIAEPIHYSLTPQSIATLRGSNRLWSNGDSVEVEYYKHTNEPQEYIPAEVLGTGNIAIVTSDGYLIGEEQDYIKY